MIVAGKNRLLEFRAIMVLTEVTCALVWFGRSENSSKTPKYLQVEKLVLVHHR